MYLLRIPLFIIILIICNVTAFKSPDILARTGAYASNTQVDPAAKNDPAVKNQERSSPGAGIPMISGDTLRV